MQPIWIELFVLIVAIATKHAWTVPADCSILSNVIPDCACEGSVSNSDDIVINCRFKGLTSMPVVNGTYTGLIYELSLFKNSIEDIPAEAFAGLRIQKLDINEDNLRNVSDRAFEGLENDLTILIINGNPVSKTLAPFNAISNLTNLQELELWNFMAPDSNLEDKYFLPFSNLQHLVLNNWDITSFGNNVFRGLNNLKSIKVISLPSLITYPIGATQVFKDTVESIEMSYTSIDTLYQYSFNGFPKLKTLIFKSNKLNIIENKTFIGLESTLEFLDLSLNKIPSSELDELQVLGALKQLTLQNIDLTQLTSGTKFLKNKPVLQKLDLQNNILLNIQSKVFAELTTLDDLNLSHNQISTMADDSLHGLTSLKSLYLDHQIKDGTQLTLPALGHMTSLTYLNLWSTQLSQQSWVKLSQARWLTQLSLKSTGITTVPDFAFKTMTNLTILYLDYNSISTIKQETFSGLHGSLREVFLSDNNINYFSSCTFHNFSSSLSIDLSRNPLHCDCSLHWLISAVKQNQISFAYHTETCDLPSDKKGELFESFQPIDFCSSAPDFLICDNFDLTTTTTTSSPTSLKPQAIVTVFFRSATTTSMTISWSLDPLNIVSYVHVLHAEATSTSQKITSRQLPTNTAHYEITQLKSSTRYEICVEAYDSNDIVVGEKCINHPTQSGNEATTTDPTIGTEMSNSQEIGIIIGSVIGGLLLFSIVIAIIYLVIVRKKSPKEKYPVQPRTFTPAELPTISPESKRYRRNKKQDQPDGHKNGVSVTVISDGHTQQPNMGRISAGSYQYLQDKQPVDQKPKPGYVNDEVKVSVGPYENDMGARPLPKMPTESDLSKAGYYNPAFTNCSNDEPHKYSEIHL